MPKQPTNANWQNDREDYMNQERKPKYHAEIFFAETGDELEEQIKEYKEKLEHLHLTEIDRTAVNVYQRVGVIVTFDTTLGVCDEEEKPQSRFPQASDIIIAVLFAIAVIVVTPLALIATVYDWVHVKVKQGVEAIKSIKVRK